MIQYRHSLLCVSLAIELHAHVNWECRLKLYFKLTQHTTLHNTRYLNTTTKPHLSPTETEMPSIHAEHISIVQWKLHVQLSTTYINRLSHKYYTICLLGCSPPSATSCLCCPRAQQWSSWHSGCWIPCSSAHHRWRSRRDSWWRSCCKWSSHSSAHTQRKTRSNDI